MAVETKIKDRKCCSLEHERLVSELDTCDQLYKSPSEWHRCARIIAQRSGRRAKQCIHRG